MPEIRHRVGIAAPTERVYAALATKDGVARFWTNQVEGDAEVGSTLSFFFGGPTPAAVMEIIVLSPNERVQWRCVDGPSDWIGTSVTFDVADTDGEAVVLFTHSGWREPTEFMHHCSTKWGTFLIGLRGGLEGGDFTAFPDDTRISSSWR